MAGKNKLDSSDLYVNMTDINMTAPSHTENPAAASGGKAISHETLYELIELFFFAYLDFVSDPDHVLDRYGFGRAHHRVLHFVHRHPGIRVAELLDILRITKQSLSRVLRELIDQNFIQQSEGRSDRRQRLLHLTDKGHILATELAKLQTERFRRAMMQDGVPNQDSVARFLFGIISPDNREEVMRLVSQAARERGP